MNGFPDDTANFTAHDRAAENDASGYSVRLFDPIHGEYTWLFSAYSDKVEWVLRDIVLFEDTTFDLGLELFMSAPETFTFDVTLATVPAASPGALAALALCFLAAGPRLRRRADGRRRADAV
jgi:hypothetical protein